MGSIVLELWQAGGAILLAAIAGWVAKRHLGGNPPQGGPETPPPAAPDPPPPEKPAVTLPAWLDFAGKLIQRLEASPSSATFQPFVQEVRKIAHDEVLQAAGLITGAPPAIFSPPAAGPVNGGKG